MQLRDEGFRGERLELARDFRGLTQKDLALQIATSSAFISNCESYKKLDPSEDFVEACAEVLGFSRAFFYARIADPFQEAECSFRHRRTTPEKAKARIRAHATLLGMVVQQLRAHFDFPNVDVPKFEAQDETEVEEAAEETRRHWKLGTEGPIWGVSRVLENAGVLIVRHMVHTTKVDAFSREGETTCIFLNDEIKSTSRWNFDIGHECGHLVMHKGIHTGDIRTETQADRFASAFLMPARAFRREFCAAPFSWRHVFTLKSRWHASAAAIVRRAYDLRLMTTAEYRRCNQYLSYKGWTKGEPNEPSFHEPELLSGALLALGKQVDITLEQLCAELRFTPKTFWDVTGVEVSPQKKAQVLQMKQA